MRKRRLLVSVGAGLLVLLVGAGLFLWYQISHLRIEISDRQLADAEVVTKGLAGMVMFADFPADLSRNRDGLIEAYKRNPQEFRRYAQMYDTVLNAKQVADSILHQQATEMPEDSSQLSMDPHSKVDSWGNAFCIVSLNGRLAVVSRGPAGIDCKALPITRKQIEESSRSVFAGPSDVIVVIVSSH